VLSWETTLFARRFVNAKELAGEHSRDTGKGIEVLSRGKTFAAFPATDSRASHMQSVGERAQGTIVFLAPKTQTIT